VKRLDKTVDIVLELRQEPVWQACPHLGAKGDSVRTVRLNAFEPRKGFAERTGLRVMPCGQERKGC
jgi:hypothetical protein